MRTLNIEGLCMSDVHLTYSGSNSECRVVIEWQVERVLRDMQA